MKSSWDEFAKRVRISGKLSPCTADDCKAAAMRLGIRKLPPSYCEYATRFGFGTWMDDLTIFVPCDSGSEMSLDSIVNVDRATANYWLQSEQSRQRLKTPDLIENLMTFGSTTSGFSLGWDVRSQAESGEMEIILVAYPEIGERCCGDFLEFLSDYWVGGKINQVYQFADKRKWITGPAFKSGK